jgi:hypothetical protein
MPLMSYHSGTPSDFNKTNYTQGEIANFINFRQGQMTIAVNWRFREDILCFFWSHGICHPLNYSGMTISCKCLLIINYGVKGSTNTLHRGKYLEMKNFRP